MRPALSLKVTIILLTVTVTASIVAVLFLVQINNVVDSWLNSSLEVAEIAGQQIKHVLIIRLQERTPAGGTKQEWTRILREDRNLASLLEATMAQAHSLIEISIMGDDGTVIASSNPMRPGKRMTQEPELSALINLNPWVRANRLLRSGKDYELRIPLGIAQQQQPVFTIHVLVSAVLLRSGLAPAMRRTGEWGLAAMLASVVLAFASAGLAVRNLSRLGLVIDRIASGKDPPPPDLTGHSTPEFAIIESKLNLLGHQFQGAVQGVAEFRGSVQKLLERLEDAILLFDAKGRLILAGGAAERILGFPIAAVADRQLGDLFPPQTPLGAVSRQAFLSHREIKDRPVAWQRGRSTAHLLVSIEFMAASPRSSKFTALVRIRDAEGHQQLETHLGVSARLDAINRITSSVAHEIKNPLNSIAARLDYLQGWATNDFPEAEQEIQFIFQEINRLDRVVRSFLDFTRPVELVQEDVDLAALTEDVANLLRMDAKQREVAVRFHRGKDGIPIRGDQDLLRQAIMNIATNGIEAMPRGGLLDIRIANQDGQCRITITDNGVGIPESERDRIFQLYFTTKENGSGLGLPMSYRAIELHGGTIEVESEPGKGTSFHLNLPINGSGNHA